MTVSIDGYPIDCSLEERLTFESEVTDDPIDKGANTSDHINAKQPVLEFDGVVSDTPVGAIALDPSRKAESGAPLPSQDAYNRFAALHAAEKTVTVICSYGKFDNMVLMMLTSVKDRLSQKAFKFTATFKRISITENKRTTVRTAIPGGAGRQNLGATDAQLKYVSENTVWVKSFRQEPDGVISVPDPLQPGRFTTSGGIHKPIRDPLYGAPVLSTTHLDRMGTNNYDRYGGVWADHYKISVGDTPNSRAMQEADGYVLLVDKVVTHAETGFSSDERGHIKTQARGYYFMSGGFPGVDGLSGHSQAPVKDVGSGRVLDSHGRSVTQRPPGPSRWNDILKNNQ